MIMGKDAPKVETIYIIVWRLIIAMNNAVIVPLMIIFYIPFAYRSLSDFVARDSLPFCAPSPRILRLSIAKGLSPDYVPPKDVSGSMRKNHFLIDFVT